MSPQPAPGTDLSRAVCVLHYGRCGSTVLTRLLVQYGCLSLGEVLHPVSGKKYEPLDGLPRERGAANSSAAVLDAAAKIVATNEDRIGRVLFEIKSLDFIREAIGDGPESFIPLMAERGVTRCIHLERRDLLARLVSTTLAGRTGVYHRTDVAERPEPFEIEPARAVAEIEQWVGLPPQRVEGPSRMWSWEVRDGRKVAREPDAPAGASYAIVATSQPTNFRYELARTRPAY